MFHQQLKTCHWWFFVDCASSEQFYKLAPAPSPPPSPEFADLSSFSRRRSSPARRKRYNLQIGREERRGQR